MFKQDHDVRTIPKRTTMRTSCLANVVCKSEVTLELSLSQKISTQEFRHLHPKSR
jgi:hypothetical protein